jgi:hypothetical protein
MLESGVEGVRSIRSIASPPGVEKPRRESASPRSREVNGRFDRQYSMITNQPQISQKPGFSLNCRL